MNQLTKGGTMLTRRNFLKSAVAVSAGAAIGIDSMRSTTSAAQTRNYVLVHGAWHGGWCWRRVADILTAEGQRVFTPSLTGVGDRAHLFSKDISLQTHVDDILSFVEAEELRGFVLVGHSYGSNVISGVADVLRERVSHYIYLDGIVPMDMSKGGSWSWSDFNTPEAREERLKLVREQGGGIALPPPLPSAFAVTEPADAAWVQRQLRPMPVQTYTGRITFKNGGSNGMKRTYIASNKPQYASLVPTYERIKSDKSWSFITIEAGHDSMVIAPRELALLLRQAG
jgi:pimeloyl-ACP methyl ester carboxylesterase